MSYVAAKIHDHKAILREMSVSASISVSYAFSIHVNYLFIRVCCCASLCLSFLLSFALIANGIVLILLFH